MKYSNRGKKELKRLVNKLSVLLENGFDKKSNQVKFIIGQIKYLTARVGFRKRFLRRALGASLLVMGLGFTQNVNAQAAFTPPVTNPFGLTSAYYIVAPVHADFDNDGDFDILVQEYYGNFQYYQNTGTTTAPAFAAPVQNPFGLTASYANNPKLTVADLDNDGDLDLMVASYNNTTYSGDVNYFQNTGTNIAPAFAAPVTNPFGITAAAYINLPELVDLDNDGDFDLMSVAYNSTSSTSEIRYQENIGTATAPNFGSVQANPFSLALPTSIYIGNISTADIDGDGDFDILMGLSYTNSDFQYYENTGTNLVPAFATPLSNPFGLVATNASVTSKANYPTILDLDGDGDLDVLTGEYGGDLIYFQNVFTTSGPLSIINVAIGTPTCSPGGDGTVTALTGGGMGPITYKIGTDSNTTGNFINYSPGTYTLRVRDSVNTIVDSIITITAPVGPSWDSTNTFINNVNCNGANDGLIFVGATGATLPLTYQLLPGFATPTNNPGYMNLAANTYTAIITDANNCIDSTSITITEPLAIVYTLDSFSNLSCFGSMDGTISTTGSGGTGSLIYSISPAVGTQTTIGNFTNLPAGTYTVTATDFNQCTATVVQTITQPPNTISISLSNITNVSCFGGSDGGFTATATGSTGFTYGVVPTNGTQATTGIFSNLPSAAYTITATDANGCSNATTQNVAQAPQIVLTASSTQNASSTTATDGSITSSASGGTGAITYSIAPAVGMQTPPGTFTGLGATIYTITATDANNCTVTTTAVVDANWPIAVNDIEKHNIKVYPNPVSDLVKLESDVEIISLSVMDITGKVIRKINNPQETVSLQNLPNGIYVLKLSLKNEETVYTRITKQ